MEVGKKALTKVLPPYLTISGTQGHTSSKLSARKKKKRELRLYRSYCSG